MSTLVAETTFRAALRRHPAGVVVVTAAGPAGPAGMTVTSLSSLSAQDALLTFNVALTASAWPVLAAAGTVGVHLLGAHQTALAARFAESGTDRFAAPTEWEPGPDGLPVLARAEAVLVARTLRTVEVADHAVVVAQVVRLLALTDRGAPLVRYDGDFRTTVPVR